MTNKPNFTPGPWSVHHGIMEPTFVYVGDDEDDTYSVVCDCYGMAEKKRSLPIMHANADLISSAPEMYTVLQHFADLINRANAGSETDDVRIFEDVVLIEQVLKKARGEK